MNSMSKGCFNDNSGCQNRTNCECVSCKRDTEPKCRLCPTIIKCGCPSSTTLPDLTPPGTNFILASVTVNTACLCNPVVKLEFTSNFVAALAWTGTLNLQVFKTCKGGGTQLPVGPSWSFSLVALVSSQTFTFFVCDVDSCFDECCTYTVVANVPLATAGTLSINNATLGAIATCGSSSCNC